ncbi:non-heme iron oxygenase ferredoxin subunit [Serinicoccus kebangsaanensis]|uniref:non-heme iron oxygenase ferredoxin subunit n=1 Tax=Serinicoccus kebangsaanensis TaxID=2602069 RepID=UPI00124C40D0|nr:non-heme iron oxygenase ferredoxin subunit [Serinicoccus kebangsaanensis]
MSEPIRVCAVDELPTTVGAVVADLDGRRVAIARDSEGSLHAFDDTCSHANVSLAEGEVEGQLIECWLHGSQFDMTTGEPVQLPATVPIAVHTLTVDEDGSVLVTLNDTTRV